MNESSFRLYVSELDAQVPKSGKMILHPGYQRNRCRKRCRTVEGLPSKTRHLLHEFLETSSIHGLGHLAGKNLHFTEYLLWMAILASAITGLSYMGLNAWTRYHEYPTVISMEKDYKNWNTTFAMVTLCPTVRIDAKKLAGLAEKYQVSDVKVFTDFFTKLSTANYADFKDLPDFGETDPQNYVQILSEAKFEFNFELSNSHNVEQFPKLIVTESGLCYGMNSELGIYFTPQNFNRKLPVKRGNENLVSGNPLDGEIFIQTMLLNSGYNTTITGPFDMPDVSVRKMDAHLNQFFMVDLAVLPIISTESVRSLTPRQRKCRFFDESNLEVSDVYSYSTCRMQCRADLAFQLCKCIPYFYRQSRGRPYCDVDGMRCLGKHARYLSILRDPVTDHKIHCGCLPLCNDVHYVIALETLLAWPVFTHFKCAMSDFPRTRLKREVIFGFGDFLVSIGGSAGLLLGCSVLSFIEILYFFTLRLFFFLRNVLRPRRWISTSFRHQ